MPLTKQEKEPKKTNVMARAKKSKNWEKYRDGATVRIELAVKVYETRNLLCLSQKELAKRAKTTQKIISMIESGDYNLGIELFSRICRSLHFNQYDFEFLYQK